MSKPGQTPEGMGGAIPALTPLVLVNSDDLDTALDEVRRERQSNISKPYDSNANRSVGEEESKCSSLVTNWRR